MVEITVINFLMRNIWIICNYMLSRFKSFNIFDSLISIESRSQGLGKISWSRARALSLSFLSTWPKSSYLWIKSNPAFLFSHGLLLMWRSFRLFPSQ